LLRHLPAFPNVVLRQGHAAAAVRFRAALTHSTSSSLFLYLSDLTCPPGSWRTPRFDARHLDAKGFREFLRYIENNPATAGLADRAVDWPWSSAQARCAGNDHDHLLTFGRWQNVFGSADTIAAARGTYLEGAIEEARQNATRPGTLHRGSRLNRPRTWVYSVSAPAR